MGRSDKKRRGQRETPGKLAMNREKRRENYLSVTSNMEEDKESKFV